METAENGKREEGAARETDRPSWVADKTVHATVDSINSAINEMIAADGGLPPIVPPGTDKASGAAGGADAVSVDKKAHATDKKAHATGEQGASADEEAHASR